MHSRQLGLVTCSVVVSAGCSLRFGSDHSDADDWGDDLFHIDGGDRVDAIRDDPCNIFVQAGCSNTADKCAWIRVSTGSMEVQQLGQVGCAPAGDKPIGASCQYGASGATTGYDDCVKGAQCLATPATEAAAGTCQQICSLTDAVAPCSLNYSCDGYPKFFVNEDTGTQLAGLCDPTCDPLTQIRDTDEAPACGSTDPVTPDHGCYGAPSQTAAATAFTCLGAGTGGHRSVVTPPLFLNSCAPGNLPLLRESTGSTQVVCIAYCKPLPTNLAYPGANRHGMSPYSCPDVGATAAGEICQHLWFWQGTATPITSTSNDYGFCVDFSKYRWDNDNDPGTPDVTWTPCQFTTPFTDPANVHPTEDLFWGCVPYPTTLAGTRHIPRAIDRGAALRPILSEAQMRALIDRRAR